MIDIARDAATIADYEGFKSQPYKDTRGLWTVGEGRCLETAPLTGAEWKYLLDAGLVSLMITQLGARHLTEERVTALDAVLCAHPVYVNAPSAVQDILVDMAFQLGASGLLTWTTFLDFIAAGQYKAAAEDGRKTPWFSESGHRSVELMNQLEAVV